MFLNLTICSLTTEPHISPHSLTVSHIPLSMLSLISIKQTNQQTCKTKELIHIIVQAYQVTAPISTTTNLVHLWYTRVKYTGNNAEICIKLYIKLATTFLTLDRNIWLRILSKCLVKVAPAWNICNHNMLHKWDSMWKTDCDSTIFLYSKIHRNVF